MNSIYIYIFLGQLTPSANRMCAPVPGSAAFFGARGLAPGLLDAARGSSGLAPAPNWTASRASAKPDVLRRPPKGSAKSDVLWGVSGGSSTSPPPSGRPAGGPPEPGGSARSPPPNRTPSGGSPGGLRGGKKGEGWQKGGENGGQNKGQNGGQSGGQSGGQNKLFRR